MQWIREIDEAEPSVLLRDCWKKLFFRLVSVRYAQLNSPPTCLTLPLLYFGHILFGIKADIVSDRLIVSLFLNILSGLFVNIRLRVSIFPGWEPSLVCPSTVRLFSKGACQPLWIMRWDDKLVMTAEHKQLALKSYFVGAPDQGVQAKECSCNITPPSSHSLRAKQ